MKLIELRSELTKRLEKKPEMKSKIRALSKLEWIESSYALDINFSGGEQHLEMDEIQRMIKYKFLDSKSIIDHIVVKNYYDLIQYLYEVIPLSDIIDLSIIEKINILLCRDGLMNEKLIKYRKTSPFVEPFYLIPPEPDSIVKEIDQLIKAYGMMYNQLNPLLRGCFIHNEFLRIYPFEENNEATARALLNFELIAGGYLPVVFNLDVQRYIECVKLHINEKDPKPFYELILEAEKETYIKYIDLL